MKRADWNVVEALWLTDSKPVIFLATHPVPTPIVLESRDAVDPIVSNTGVEIKTKFGRFFIPFSSIVRVYDPTSGGSVRYDAVLSKPRPPARRGVDGRLLPGALRVVKGGGETTPPRRRLRGV